MSSVAADPRMCSRRELNIKYAFLVQRTISQTLIVVFQALRKTKRELRLELSKCDFVHRNGLAVAYPFTRMDWLSPILSQE